MFNDNNGEMIARSFMLSYLPNAHYPLNLVQVTVAIEIKFDIDVIIEECESVPREITAQLACSDWVASILVNKFHPENKKRFGICHEFGHLLLEHTQGNPYPGLNEPDQEKDEANSFAAALLMPSHLVHSLSKRYSDSITYLVQKMTEYFKVSTEAASRRLVETNYIPGLIALVDPNIGKLNWEYHSPSISLDREYFREFLVSYFKQPKRYEENHEIMGYPFKIEVRRIWGKCLIACIPLNISQCAREPNARYARRLV